MGGLLPSAVAAEDKVKVRAHHVTLSGPPAVLGGQVLVGFNLAVKTLDGKLGGLDAEVTVVDDELKPEVAVNKVKRLLERDQGRISVVGPVFSNVLLAIKKSRCRGPITFLISPNAGTSNFAGKQCNPNLFVTSYQNDQVHEVLGKYAQDKGYKSAFLLAPELPGRQGQARRLQARLQGRDRRRGLHARSANSTSPPNSPRSPPTKPEAVIHLHARRHGREPRQAIPSGRARLDSVPIGVHRGRVDTSSREG